MENTARLTGYAVALAMAVALMTMVASLQNGNLFRRTTVKVQFSALGTLMEDDPVKLRGVEIGRVDRIDPGIGGPVATLELYKRLPLPADSRFVNYNYSLFGTRMVVLVPGASAALMDFARMQPGVFLTGVTETIHKVDELLRTVVEYKGLSDRLDRGGEGNLSLQQMLATQVYPALDGFGDFAMRLNSLEDRASRSLDNLSQFSGRLQGYGKVMEKGGDSLVLKTQLTLERLTVLTAQTTTLVNGLETMMAKAQDSNSLAGKVIASRDLYEKTLTMTHAMLDLLKMVKKEGLRDIIHFWRNVHIHAHKQTP